MFQPLIMNKNTKHFRINEQICSNMVRIVGDHIIPGVYDIKKALQMANDLNADLVEISRKSDIPICKITDFQKFLYEWKRKQKENKKQQFQKKVKEIRFTPNIGEHDYQFKVKQGIDFLKDKHKLQISILFQGRMIRHLKLGYELVTRLTNDLSQYGWLENQPKIEGQRMLIRFQPK